MSDLFYRLGHALLNQAIRLYYRRIEVVGRDHLPNTGPAILVSNHPNSVMDAILDTPDFRLPFTLARPLQP